MRFLVPYEFREEVKATNYAGQTGFCQILRFPASFCTNVVLQKLPPHKCHHCLEKAGICNKSAKNCEFGSRFLVLPLHFLQPPYDLPSISRKLRHLFENNNCKSSSLQTDGGQAIAALVFNSVEIM